MNEGDTKYHVSSGRVLTPAEIARLDEIEARMGDSVDIPEMSDEDWAAAPRRKRGKASAGEMVSIRLDPDVGAWLQAKGPAFQTEVNRMLRERMLAEG